MSASREELIDFLAEAEAAGDMETANAVLDKIEAMQSAPAQTAQPQQDTLMSRFLNAVGGHYLDNTKSTQGILDTTATMGQNMAAESIAGLAGIGQTLNPLAPEGAGGAAVEQVRGVLSRQPQTDKGQQIMGKMGEISEEYIAPVVDMARTGEKTMESGGGPLLATANQMLPEIAGALSTFGFKGFGGKKALPKVKVDPKVGGVVSNLGKEGVIKSKLLNNPDVSVVEYMLDKSKNKVKPTPKRVEPTWTPPVDKKAVALAESIKSNTGDVSTAKVTLNQAGKITKSPAATEAIKQGYSELLVAGIKEAPKVEKANYRKMVDIIKRRMTNLNENARPSDVVGNSLKSRLDRVKQVNKQSGRLVDKAAKRYLQGKKVDVAAELGGFRNAVADMGGRFDEKGRLQFGADSQLLGQNPPKKLLGDILIKIDALGPNPDGYKLHQLKQYISDRVSFGKSKMEGSNAKVDKLVKGLRAGINEKLKGFNKEYDKVNTAYSETAEVLDNFQSAAGKSVDLFGDNANSAVGQSLRRLLGNAQSRSNLQGAVEQMEMIATKYGGKYEDSLVRQMKAIDEIEKVLGPMTETSFLAEVGKGAAAGVDNLSLRQGGAGVAKAAINKARGINQKNAIKALERLVAESK